MADEVSCWVCHRPGEPGQGHMELLKRLRIRISEAAFEESTPPRDLAALSRQLRDIAKEIDSLEERARLEGKGKRNGGTGSGASQAEGWTPDSV